MLIFCGYFPKLITPAQPALNIAGLTDICSISACLAQAPPGWINHWAHNALGLYDTVALAESVIPEAEAASYELFGYRFAGQVFLGGSAEPWVVPELPCAAPGKEFASVGFDAVSKTGDFFEHSPLSCNRAAEALARNEHCLFNTLEEAGKGAMIFSGAGYEPGPYYVAQVLRRRRATQRP
jgi:hypothetical protein